MAVDYPQTDTVAPLGVIQACAPVAPAGDSDAIQATEGGTPGSTELACDVAPGGSELCFAIEVDISDETSLDAGGSSIPINITTAQGNLTLESVHVCRVNSAGESQETLGSETGIGLDISAGRVFTRTPTLSAASAHNAGDKVYVTFGFANSHNHASRSVAITPDQTVTMPFTAGGGTPVSQSKSVPSEALADVAVNEGAPSEALAAVLGSRGVPAEFLARVSAVRQAPSEALAVSERSRPTPAEALAREEAGRVVPSEFLAVARRSRGIPAEALKGEEAGFPVVSEALAGIEASRLVPTEVTSTSTGVSSAVQVPTEALQGHAPAPSLYRPFSPTMDGPFVSIEDGVPRSQFVRFEAGEYATPLWLQTEAGLVMKIGALPWQARFVVGRCRLFSSDPG